MDTIATILAGVGGVVFGSFGSVVVHRVPRQSSIVKPRSRCPACDHELSAADNIPILSYVLLRGRCGYCKTRISFRYPAVEIFTGALWALAVARLGAGWHLIAYLPFLWVLVVLSLIDLEHKILPNRIVYPSLVAGPVLLGIAALGGPGLDPWLRALAAAVAGGGAFFVIALISPAGMGMGDVKLAALIGMFLGYLSWGRVLTAFFLSFLLGAVVGVGLMVAGRAGRKSAIPFGPFMALGAVIALLYGEPLIRLWRP
jgi:leader peptidase (prepilin peptidase) / N-methyltransferase